MKIDRNMTDAFTKAYSAAFGVDIDNAEANQSIEECLLLYRELSGPTMNAMEKVSQAAEVHPGGS